MRAFRVELNGKRMCVAGVGDHGVLTAIVDYVGGRRRELSLHVGGLLIPTEEHAIWRNRDLKVGDEVLVTIVETDAVDKPRKRYRRDSETDVRDQKALVRAPAKKFGWRIVAGPKKSR